MITILFVIGTRPEAIKLYPVMIEFLNYPNKYRAVLLSTGQQKELLDDTLLSLSLKPDINLNLMMQNQSLSSITAKLFESLEKEFLELNPDYIFIHGDTITSMVAGIVSKFNKIKSFHVEAGLRSNDLMSPWPEEMNRRINSITSDFHFAPTLHSADNLMNEGISKNKIFVTGNTGIDTLRLMLKNMPDDNYLLEYLASLEKDFDFDINGIVLITIHRRENFEYLKEIFSGIKKLALSNPNYVYIFPVHLNPNVYKVAYEALSGIKNLVLVEPLSYQQFIKLLILCKFIITDSGGIQEEATYLGKPTVLCRKNTERQEGVESSNIILAGINANSIYEACRNLIYDKEFYSKYSNPSNIFGDGHASYRIFDFIENLNN